MTSTRATPPSLRSGSLPTALSASREWRRFTITLVWLSPVNVRSQKYRMARLWFRPPREVLAVDPVEADRYAVEKGTVQHQVLEGNAAVAFLKGTELTIDVDCRADAGTLPNPVRFGIVASLEVSPNLRVDIHSDVVARLRQPCASGLAPRCLLGERPG